MVGLPVLLQRLRRGVLHSLVLLAAVFSGPRRRLWREARALARTLPGRLEQPLPAAMQALTPAVSPPSLSADAIRQIVDAVAAWGGGRPLGICLRRSLLRYYFLHRAGLRVVVNFGARRRGDALNGHAWLTLHGEPYHEQPEHYHPYTVMWSYPDHV